MHFPSILFLFLLLHPVQASSLKTDRPIHPLFATRNALLWKDHSQILATLAACDNTCAGCRRKCSLRKLDYYASRTTECLRNLQQLRKTIPDWCTDDFYQYMATEQFQPSMQHCQIDVAFCVETVASQAKSRLESGVYTLSDRPYLVATMARNVSVMQDRLAYERQRLKNSKDYVAKVADVWHGKWMKDALQHLADPVSNGTRFSDGVFMNYSNSVQENERFEKDTSRKGLTYVRIENRFVKEMAAAKIPHFLAHIAALKNGIHSRKDEMDAVLSDLKTIAVEAAEAQKQATNSLYETRHAETIDGEIIDQDDELFNLYTQLQDERNLLVEASKQSSLAKKKMVSIMRYIVGEISRRQKQKGCSENEIMAPHH